MRTDVRCVRCDEVIGIYEPVIVVRAGGAWETSRAAEPALVADSPERYHRACYLGRAGARPAR